jgi:hypothetical protein
MPTDVAAQQAAFVEAVWAELKPDLPPRNPSDCVIRCYLRPPGPQREKCLQECKERAAIAEVAARLRAELFKSFAEVIWEGGDIDPRPLEAAVRSRFSANKTSA